MKLLFKQRIFSWFDSYDIYDEYNNTIFTVKGELGWGHCLRVYDKSGIAIGLLKEKVISFLPQFQIYIGDRMVGKIQKEFAFFVPKYNIDYNGWHIEGDFFEWDYQIIDVSAHLVATISKQLFNFSDTYILDIVDDKDALAVLMFVLAIDAEKCSRN